MDIQLYKKIDNIIERFSKTEEIQNLELEEIKDLLEKIIVSLDLMTKVPVIEQSRKSKGK